MNHFDKNLKLCQKYAGSLYDYLTAYDYSKQQVVVEYARNGEAIIRTGDIYLNSRYSPTNEASRFLKNYYDMPDGACLVMFGMANGCYIKDFLDNAKNNVSCIVYEPSAHIFAEIMRNVDLSKYIADQRLVLCVNGINGDEFHAQLLKKLHTTNMKTNKYMECPNYQKAFASEYEWYKEFVYDANSSYQMIINSYVQSGKQMAKTVVTNLRYLTGCRSMVDYIGKFDEEMPAIIVSAGPSLEKNVKLLKQAKGKALIVAVDHAMQALSKRGIVPDIVISVDSSKSSDLFDRDVLSDVLFFAEAGMNDKVLEKVKPKNLVFYSAGVPVWTNLFDRVGSKIQALFSGGSVAIDALVVLIQMKFKRIILIGQDLALLGEQYYADDKKGTVESDLFLVPGIDGNEVYTTRSLFSFLKTFEDIIRGQADVEVIDATEGGARIAHTKVMPLQATIDAYCTRQYDLQDILLSPKRLFLDDDRQFIVQAYERMKQNLVLIRPYFDDVSRRIDEGLRLLAKRENKPGRFERIDRLIEEANERYCSLEERLLLKCIAGRAEYEMLTDLQLNVDADTMSNRTRLYNKCKAYFLALSEAAKELLCMVDEQKNRFIEDNCKE